jgi:hypothetical protein
MLYNKKKLIINQYWSHVLSPQDHQCGLTDDSAPPFKFQATLKQNSLLLIIFFNHFEILASLFRFCLGFVVSFPKS